MLFADQLRGADGTGIFYNNKEIIKTLKAPVASSTFICDKQFDKAEDEIFQRANFVVGHNRAATIGKLTHQNTHPFRCNNITLVHNGTLHAHRHLADVESDSNAIAESISKIGFRETIKKVDGAFALIWYDEKQKTLNFCRNSKRPLWLIESRTLFCFVSEPKLAEWIFSRNNEQVVSVTQIPENTLYQFENGKMDKYETSKFDVFKFVPPQFMSTSKPAQNQRIQSKSMLGLEITFIATHIDPHQEEKLIGEWEDSVSGETVECRFWAGSPKLAQERLKDGVLKGKVSHTGWQADNKSEFFIVKDVYKSNITVVQSSKNLKKGVETANGKKLTYQQASKVSKEPCLYCAAPIGELLYICEIWDENGHLEGLCPDCTDYMYRHSISGMMQ